jgi:NitT/TauT family transport system substrate-binding protein
MSLLSRRTILAALGAVSIAFPHRVRAQSLQTLRLGAVPEDSATPVLYAQQSGLFQRYGLDVKLVAERSGPAISSAVLGGGYDIGKASVTPLVIGHAKNLPFTIIAPGGISNASAPIDALFVRGDSPYTSAAALSGKTFGVYGIGDIYTISTRAWLEKNGVDPSGVKFVEIPISAMVPAIESGRIDAGSMNEPAVQLGLQSPKLRVLAHAFAAVAPRFMYTAWFATSAFAAKNGATLAAFAHAMREAAAYCNTHHAETVELLAAFTSVDTATIRRMQRVEQGATLDARLLQPVVDAMARGKDIQASFDARDLLEASLRSA